MKEMVGGCCVCSDERGWAENPLVYCDGHGCNVAVHQACYGIVAVPSGPWYCRKCESQERAARVRCELCPQKDGALKRTDSGGWCHVVCALYIPEAWFADVDTMEPIVLKSVPQDRFNKVCYICEENKKETTKNYPGACMQCNKTGCRQFFHVTCAQGHGLLCEESGHSGDNVRYCGYCSYHYKKVVSGPSAKRGRSKRKCAERPLNYASDTVEISAQKKDANIKVIPAFKPIPADSASPDTTPEKAGIGPPKQEKEKRLPKAAEQKVSGSGDSNGHVKPQPCKARPVFLSSLSTSSINSDSSHASAEVQGLTDPELKKNSTSAVGDVSGGAVVGDSELSLNHDSGGVASGGVSAAVVSASSVPPPPRSHSAISVENLTLSSSCSNSHGDIRPGQEASFPASENLFAPLCNSSHSSSSSSGIFGSASNSSVPASHPVSSSVYENSFPSSGVGLNSTVGGVGLSGLLNAPLASQGLTPVTPAVPEPEVTSAKRQRSNSKSVDRKDKKEKKPRKPSGEVKSKGSRAGHKTGSSNRGKKDATQGRSVTGTALGHHNYASSVFGGGPCFQSPVSLTNFSPPDGEMVNGTSAFVPPPRIFPSLHNKPEDIHGGMPFSMEELLEQQWEHSAKFLMEQSQHFDVATLLNQMNHLKTENERLEKHVKQLQSHRDHLLSTNARLAIPFTLGPEDVLLSTHEKSQSPMETGPQSKSHHLNNLSIPCPSHLPMVEQINSPVETMSPLSVSLPLRMPDSMCFGQVSSMANNPALPELHGQQVMYSVVHPPPPHVPLPAFQQLVQTAGTKVSDSKSKDKT
ncbi:protein AF-10-like isoform X2 [Littorina saxatilis]|uniref:protein AF-10-like isoform X2 n=1 Tax=Littorina saxatilis TaxID=31220 RepID=UPI0038B43705